MEIVDLAYQIIELHEENQYLKRENAHLQNINKINGKTINRSDKHTRDMTGMILMAALDPKSALNRTVKG